MLAGRLHKEEGCCCRFSPSAILFSKSFSVSTLNTYFSLSSYFGTISFALVTDCWKVRFSPSQRRRTLLNSLFRELLVSLLLYPYHSVIQKNPPTRQGKSVSPAGDAAPASTGSDLLPWPRRGHGVVSLEPGNKRGSRQGRTSASSSEGKKRAANPAQHSQLPAEQVPGGAMAPGIGRGARS